MAQAFAFKEFHEEHLRDVALVRTSADVCLCGYLKTTGRRVAVKLLTCNSTELERLPQLRDAVIRSRVCSERILLPLGVYRSRALVGLVRDWMDEGALHSILYETHLYPDLAIPLRFRILLDVAEGLSHLHALSLPHAALKATNVLLDQQYRAKLCDWGRVTELGVQASLWDGTVPCFRDLAYLAPEVLQGGPPTAQADMYSFGVLVWEVLNRRQPCEGIDQLQTVLLLAQEGVVPCVRENLLPSEIPQGHVFIQLMIRCWSSEPKRRPQAEECAAELRKAVAAFEPEAFTTAVQQLKACKERALLACKHSPAWDQPIGLSNMEIYSGCRTSKNLTSKEIPMDMPYQNNPGPHIPGSERVPRGSPPLRTPPRTSLPGGCCWDAANRPVASRGAFPNRLGGGVCGETWPCPLSPSNAPHVSPNTHTQTPLQQHSASQQAVSSVVGRSCCRLLMEHRELIVHCMTEGRLNNLLDMLRARRAVTRENYEFITAALTLTARTRCLLDTCACLGESTAVLVATTLGLVSTQTARAHKWLAR